MLEQKRGTYRGLKLVNYYAPLLSRFLLLILCPVIIGCYYLLQTLLLDGLPASHAEVTVPDLLAPTFIRRDQHGTAYIQGDHVNDVYFATGYAHAQDRLWQLELHRRLSQGRLSEVFGKSMLNRDIFVRSLGIQQAAARSYQHLNTPVRTALDAYAAGINAWLSSAPVLPIEFVVLGIQPQPWSAVDSVAWGKMFALNLSGNFRDEAKFLLAKQYLTDEQLQLFYPGSASDLSTAVVREMGGQAAQLLNTLDDFRTDQQLGGRYVGSNAWVVSGQRTSSGAPILANDPHLGIQQSSLWYSLQQKFSSGTVSGMSLVGLPFVIFGKNDHIAWGGTSMMADVQDLYIEKVNPSDPNLYWQNGEWHAFKTEEASIHVRAEFPDLFKPKLKPVKVLLRQTERGPVISDVMPGTSSVFSLQWVALQGVDLSIEAFYHLNFAQDWQSFSHAFIDYKAPALNLFYADITGNIGYRGVGQIPIRLHGKGQIPLPADVYPNNWLGSIPFQQMPVEFNPASGILLNANNSNVSEDYPYFISSHFAPPSRASRIENLLNAEPQLDVGTTASIQADVKDLSVNGLLDVFSAVNSHSAKQQHAIATVARWDQFAELTSVGASIYYGWTRNLRQVMFQDELSGYWNKSAESALLKSLPTLLEDEQLAILLREDSPWCDDISSEVHESCNTILLQALDKTLKELEKLAGTDVNDWQWGLLHQVEYHHTPFSQIRPLNMLFERTYPSAGSVNTVNVAAGSFDSIKGYRKNFGAGFRQIIQLSETTPEHLFVNSTGQSGHIASAHYADQNLMMQHNSYISFQALQYKSETLLQPQAAQVESK